MPYTCAKLAVRSISGGFNIYPKGVTTDDLYIYPNMVDTTPRIVLFGGATIGLICPSGGSVSIYNGATQAMDIHYSTPDMILEGLIADKNIFLKTAGTGKVKFGTYTASGDAVATGHIDIIDADGNARKLMVKA